MNLNESIKSDAETYAHMEQKHQQGLSRRDYIHIGSLEEDPSFGFCAECQNATPVDCYYCYLYLYLFLA